MRRYLSNQLEPSRLRATIVAVFALLGSLGLVASVDVPGWVDVVLPAAALLVPYAQHWLVRPQVVPVGKIRAGIATAPYLTDNQRAELDRNLDAGTVPIVVYPPDWPAPPVPPVPRPRWAWPPG